MKKNSLLIGTTPPRWISSEELAEHARRAKYQPRLLAQALGLSARTLGRHFQQAFNCAPSEWLQWQRVADGVELLGSGLTTKQVALQLGFRDRSSLFRAFREQLRSTPRNLISRLDAQAAPAPKKARARGTAD